MYLLSFCVQIASLKRMKKELESHVEEVEDELDDANIELESLQQVFPLSYPFSLLLFLLLLSSHTYSSFVSDQDTS